MKEALSSSETSVLNRATRRNIPERHCSSTRNKLDWEVRFEVFTAVTMKNTAFSDVTPCGSCKNRLFGGKGCITPITAGVYFACGLKASELVITGVLDYVIVRNSENEKTLRFVP
jgi:hypothetical protein